MKVDGPSVFFEYSRNEESRVNRWLQHLSDDDKSALNFSIDEHLEELAVCNTQNDTALADLLGLRKVGMQEFDVQAFLNLDVQNLGGVKGEAILRNLASFWSSEGKQFRTPSLDAIHANLRRVAETLSCSPKEQVGESRLEAEQKFIGGTAQVDVEATTETGVVDEDQMDVEAPSSALKALRTDAGSFRLKSANNSVTTDLPGRSLSSSSPSSRRRVRGSSRGQSKAFESGPRIPLSSHSTSGISTRPHLVLDGCWTGRLLAELLRLGYHDDYRVSALVQDPVEAVLAKTMLVSPLHSHVVHPYASMSINRTTRREQFRLAEIPDLVVSSEILPLVPEDSVSPKRTRTATPAEVRNSEKEAASAVGSSAYQLCSSWNDVVTLQDRAEQVLQQQERTDCTRGPAATSANTSSCSSSTSVNGGSSRMHVSSPMVYLTSFGMSDEAASLSFLTKILQVKRRLKAGDFWLHHFPQKTPRSLEYRMHPLRDPVAVLDENQQQHTTRHHGYRLDLPFDDLRRAVAVHFDILHDTLLPSRLGENAKSMLHHEYLIWSFLAVRKTES
ncbi:unnamed protein product [Amoebophrya sp. A25]|nr:unnamed protein product [Amoebophrya sp. A25]|eukprot:GSA25T00000604001.1